ncbi:nucleotide exchange factor Fes1-domain-containing protein [Cantharellus anzutake]|uniref:nucleotide exchange factor Fes1-domain-containing protein n=1 Tax=Cantharellus anzutake TaxID=1750568 RepID=UPI0019055806|nr:nucleotide exchange factor Fes1-domain-containing protein [Cantharellus anzutake]KAF8313308.1 nucleotide exchange factor Fes1-domain-containing protein [Cantharellus anzutake]
MESLLRWGLTHSDPQGPPPSVQPGQKIDPGIIDVILGKPDAVQMKENLAVATDESRSLDDRLTALDNFEMLIESIDNANNLTPLKMWDTLIAIQNNSKAQQEYLSRDPLPAVLSVLSSPDAVASPQTRAKALYTISGATKHNAEAVRKLESLGGWDVLKNALKDSSIQVRRKAAFLLTTLLLQDVPKHVDSLPAPSSNTSDLRGIANRTSSSTYTAGLQTSLFPDDTPFPETTTSGEVRAAFKQHDVVRVDGDLDFEEKVVRCLLTYLDSDDGELGNEEKAMLRRLITGRSEREGRERWGADEREYAALEKAAQ